MKLVKCNTERGLFTETRVVSKRHRSLKTLPRVGVGSDT